MTVSRLRICLAVVISLCVFGSAVHAASYREKGKAAKIADSDMEVSPPRDWNRLDARPGKKAETWTLDGEQLNDVTFYSGIEPGQPLVRERNKKRDPLPKFTSGTLLVEVPELLGNTYRAYKKISGFNVVNADPVRFLNLPAVKFSYEYTDQDDLPRKGEAIATLKGSRLYMVTFDAPRLHYFDRTLPEFRALLATVSLGG